MFKNIIKTCTTKGCILTWKGTPEDVYRTKWIWSSYFPFNTYVLLPYSIPWPNHFNDIESFLRNVCTFPTSWWSKEEIKSGPLRAAPLLHSAYFQTLSALEIFFSTQILWALKNARHSWKRQTFALWIRPFCKDFLRATNLCLFDPFPGVINS